MIYLLDGVEDYKRDLKIKEISKDAEKVVFIGWSRDLEDVWTTVSFWGKKVVVLEMEKLEADKAMEAAIGAENDVQNDLIIAVKYPRKDLKVYKKLMKSGKHMTCDKLNQKELQHYIEKAVKQLGIQMEPGVVAHFIRRSGYQERDDINLYTINVYLKQLAFYGHIITADMVDGVLPKILEEDTMKLTRLLFDGKKEAFMNLVADLLEAKKEPIAMLGLILRHFRIAYKASLYKELNETELAKVLNLNTWQIQSVSQVRRLKEEQITECMKDIQQASDHIKSGYELGPVAFTICMGQLIHHINDSYLNENLL